MSATSDPRPQPLSQDEEALIRTLGQVTYALPRALEADLMREQHMSLSEYLTLMHLSEAPHQLMRMSELAAACHLSLSGMTRIVSRLEGRALVQRVKCDEDARGWNAVITDVGLARLEKAWPTHLDSIRRHLLDHLDGLDLKQLTLSLSRVATG
ncbi:MarR family transcriptional regulator [Microbispora sp. RL4-1S]|uniref:MarR family transcriptional regulator n=1 Tax=Microbispora oryzae TaxID=2806554 RepID=A0A940WMC9_9ACTN|nr:MarR family transcriptional regulator [Microbispora oryzae]MBP2708136.1 MarR family transcriptional regulator [Microbispora oryzae]